MSAIIQFVTAYQKPMPLKFFTRDAAAKLRFFTVEKLGEKQSLTPEGFLVVEDVPIARTGTMIYGPNEVPITAGPDGIVKVHRTEKEVFRPEYIASYLGKPVANDHPPEDVIPENYKEYAVGTVLNPRRGIGLQADLLIADLIITDPEAIRDVRAGKREVSCGYDADYVELGLGEGEQTNMIGNHVALVESGRCGSRCAIGDKQTVKEDEMKFRDNKTLDSKFLDSKLGKLLFRAFKAKDEGALKEVMDEAGEIGAESETASGGVHVHMGDRSKFTDDDHEEYRSNNEKEHAEMRARLDALEGKSKDEKGESEEKETKEAKAATGDDNEEMDDKKAKDNKEIEGDLEEEAPKGTGDKARKARDSQYMEDSFQQTVAMAEILVPGIRIPTFDRAADPKKTLDTICNFRRAALDSAYSTADRAMIEEINGGELNLSGMKCNQVRNLFRGAVAAKRAATNARQTNDRGIDLTSQQSVSKSVTPADVNKRMREFYASN